MRRKIYGKIKFLLQSDWIKKNAKSGAARNEEYYGKIEDDNRKAHVKFRKENPIFYEQVAAFSDVSTKHFLPRSLNCCHG